MDAVQIARFFVQYQSGTKTVGQCHLIDNLTAGVLKQPKGDCAFAEILLAARESGLERLEVACQLAQCQGKPSAAIVLNELRRLTSPPRVGER